MGVGETILLVCGSACVLFSLICWILPEEHKFFQTFDSHNDQSTTMRNFGRYIVPIIGAILFILFIFLRVF